MSSRKKKLALAAGLLGIGVSAAMLFQRSTVDEASEDLAAAPVFAWSNGSATGRAPVADDATNRAPTSAESAGGSPSGGLPPAAAPAAGTSPGDGPSASAAAWPAQPTAAHRAEYDATRYEAASYGASSHEPPPSTAGGAIDEPAADSAAEFAARRPTATTSAQLRRHKIVDGDTLSALAEQYLGRADRYVEIFRLNQHVLRHPDLLPIGVTLDIPPHEPVTSSAPSATGQPTPAVPSPAPLVPLPPGGRGP